MASFTAGTTFTDGVANDVTAAKLGALVTNATPTSGFIQDRTAETVIASNDTVLIGDASDSNNLKRITVDNLMKADMTGNINSTSGTIATATLGTSIGTAATFTSGTLTTGVIPNLTIGTTTGTAANFTNGTITTGLIPTLTAGTTTSTAATITTGTIPTLVSTTLITSGTGTAAAPAIVPTGDTNNGLFFPAADNIAVSTNGTERVRVDSSGNVGIGTTSPAYKFVVSSSGSQGIEINPTSSTLTDIYSYNRATSAYINSQINALNLIVSTGVSSSTERLRITSGGYFKAQGTSTYADSTGSYHELVAAVNDTAVVNIKSNATNGNQSVIISQTNNDQNATGTYFVKCLGGVTERATIRTNGGLANYSANNVNLSDQRLKKDIQNSPSYLDKICSIPVVNFKYKDQTHDDYNLGVIAQQVEAVCPELIDTDGFGETPADGIPLKAVYQTDLQYALMKCIQELKAENDSLKTRIAALEAA